jgi:membrane-bound metal-dependent hydrolase YbcI (DUF457 family)
VVKIDQKSSLRKIGLAAVAGIYLHIILDSRVHADIRPFYPLLGNPFLDESVASIVNVYIICLLSGIGGIIVYVIRSLKLLDHRT